MKRPRVRHEIRCMAGADLYGRLLREAATRGLTLSECVRRDLEVGHTVRARAEATVEQESRERRSLTWAIDDIEHERDRGRGR